MGYKLQELIDIPLLQDLLEKLNNIYSFPSAIIDNDGNVLAAVAWQELCTKYHRAHPECATECIKSDKYILSHLSEANPTVSYVCPHGLTDTATPLVIDGLHLGNFFTGQFFMEKPDMEFFRGQAKRYGFNEENYLRAVRAVPVWSKEKLTKNLEVIRGLIDILAELGLRNLKDREFRTELHENERKYKDLFEKELTGSGSEDLNEFLTGTNQQLLDTLGYSKNEVTRKFLRYYSRVAAAESNQFNRCIIDNVAQGIIVYDKTLRYKVWNSAMEKITGMPAEKVLGKLPYEVFPFLENDGVMQAIRRALEGHPAETLKIPYSIPESGKTGWVEDKSIPLKDLQGNIIGVLGTVNDITSKVLTGMELESTKEKSQSQEKQFQEFFDRAADPILIAEMSTGIIVAANNSASKLLRAPLDKIIGMHQKALHPDHVQSRSIKEFSQHVEEVKVGNTANPIESIVLCSDGEEIPVEILSAEVTYQGKKCIMGTFRDISLRRQKEAEHRILEEKLKHSHNLMQYVIEHNRGAVAIHDKDLKYVYVSQRYLTDYRVKEKDIIGRHHYEVFPDLPQKWRDVHQKALKGIISSAEDDAWTREDGTTDWTRWECRPWFESDGSIGGIIIYTEVINKLKETELALIKAKEKAEESDRLKTAFLRNMSHEIRTPLNGIVGFSQILAEKVCSEYKKKEYSDMIMNCSEKLLDIISNVTEMALIQSGQVAINLSEFDLAQLVREVADSFEKAANNKNNRISVIQEIPLPGSTIESDRLKIRKIFRHLVDNAVKFTDNGSIKIMYRIADNYLHFSVSDTGIGISKEVLEYLFVPFSQAKETLTANYSGSGLGLSLVKEYLRLLDGTIHIESEPGIGTTTKVRVPIRCLSVNNQIREIDREDEVRGTKIISNKTILIAEDEIMNFLFLKELLNFKRNKIIHAKNGKMAVEACMENDHIDLVLMDLKMPLMDGETAAIQIKKIRPGLPIIAQTAYALEEIKNKTSHIFDDYLIKPIDLTMLKQKVEKFIK